MENAAELKRRILETAFPAAPKARGDPAARVARLTLQAPPIYEPGSVVDATVDLVTRHPAADASLVKLFVHLWLAWADDAELPNGDSGLPEAIPCVHALGPDAAESSDPGVLLTEICHEGPAVLADPGRVAALLDTEPRTAPPGAWKTEADFFAALFSVFFDAERTTALPALRTGSQDSDAKAYAEAAARLPPAERRRLQLQDRSGLLQFLRDAGDVRSSQALAILSAPVKFYRFDGATGLAEAMASASTWTDVCRVVSRSYHHLSTYGGTEARDVMLELAKTALALYSKSGSPSDAAAMLFPMVKSRVVPLVGTIYSNKNVYATDACVGEWCEMNGMSLLRRPMLGFRAEFYMAAFFDRVAGETTGMPLGTVEFLCHLVDRGVRVPGSYGSPQLLLKSIGMTGFVYSRRNQPFYDIMYESMRLLAPAELLSRVLSGPLAELKSGMPTRADELVPQPPPRSKSLPVGEARPEEPPRLPTGADGGDSDESGWSSMFMEQYENLRTSLLAVAESMDQLDVLVVLAMLVHSLVSTRAVFRKLGSGSSWHKTFLVGQTTVLAVLSVLMCWYSVMVKPTSTADSSQVAISRVKIGSSVISISKMKIFALIPNLGIEIILAYAFFSTLSRVLSMLNIFSRSDAESMQPRQRNPGSRSAVAAISLLVGVGSYADDIISSIQSSLGVARQAGETANTVASATYYEYGGIAAAVGAIFYLIPQTSAAATLWNVANTGFTWAGFTAFLAGAGTMAYNRPADASESLFNQSLKEDLPRLFGPEGLPDLKEIAALNSIVLAAGTVVRYSNFYSSLKRMAAFSAHLSVSIDMFYTFIAAYGPTINQLLDRFLTPVGDESDIPEGLEFTFPEAGGTRTWNGRGGTDLSDTIVRYLRVLKLSPQAYWALLFMGSLCITRTFQSSASIPDDIKKRILTKIRKKIEAKIDESTLLGNLLKKRKRAISGVILDRYRTNDMLEELGSVRNASDKNIAVILDEPVGEYSNQDVARIRLSVEDVISGDLGTELNIAAINLDGQTYGAFDLQYQTKLKSYILALNTPRGERLKKALYGDKIMIAPKDYQKSKNPQGNDFILFMNGIPGNVPELGSPAYLLIKAAILGSAKVFTDVDGAQIAPQTVNAAFQCIVYLMEHMGR
jgi:hypothetical protein